MLFENFVFIALILSALVFSKCFKYIKFGSEISIQIELELYRAQTNKEQTDSGYSSRIVMNLNLLPTGSD